MSFQNMSFYRLAHRLLLFGFQRAQSMGQCDPHRAGFDPCGHRRAKLVGQRQSREHPRGLVTTDLGDRSRSQPLIVAQGMDHLGLVDGRDGSRWTVGLQQGDLLFHAGKGIFQYHRYPLEPQSAPFIEALEAIDHFEKTIVTKHHAKWKLGERNGPRG